MIMKGELNKPLIISSLMFLLMAYVGYVFINVLQNLNYDNISPLVGMSMLIFTVIWIFGTIIIPVNYM
ncbi:MAG: hypothetical protein KKB31_02240 [Nanoarchaeota archaeon]|nr:hypothetical protein [Nanoarchaeota archaeon]